MHNTGILNLTKKSILQTKCKLISYIANNAIKRTHIKSNRTIIIIFKTYIFGILKCVSSQSGYH